MACTGEDLLNSSTTVRYPNRYYSHPPSIDPKPPRPVWHTVRSVPGTKHVRPLRTESITATMGAAEISPSDVVSFVLDEWQCNTTARLRKWSDAAGTWGFGGFVSHR
uniref:Uncharacterized protein n=1 Tax=Proboscia inermis TaxID=420281 RepID=A0A7S0C554_9STRA